MLNCKKLHCSNGILQNIEKATRVWFLCPFIYCYHLFKILTAFSQIPDCVKVVVAQVACPYMVPGRQERVQEEMPNANVHPQNEPQFNDDCITLSDDEEEIVTSSPRYLIDGKSILIGGALSSLAPRAYISDEIVDISLALLQAKYPEVHVFTAIETRKILDAFDNISFKLKDGMKFDDHPVFRKFFFKNRYEQLPLSDTFLSKKMLFFPFCHLTHWVLLVVVNPLLADVLNSVTERRTGSGQKAAAYYFDSLKGTPRYKHMVLRFRIELVWGCVLSFLSEATRYHGEGAYINHANIKCTYETNLPSQINSFDCGPHLITNAHIIAENLETLTKGPTDFMISDEKVKETRAVVANFRVGMIDYLNGCREN